MTDTLGFTEPETAQVRYCETEGCMNELPTSGSGWRQRKFCDEHQAPKRPPRKRRDRRPRGTTNVNVNIGARATKKSAETEQMRERALWLANFISGLVLLLGQSEDSADIRQAAPAWAEAVTQLAEYESWLRKLLLSGGEQTDRAMAWVAVVSATVAMILPILLRHETLPPQVATMIRSFIPTTDAQEIDLSDLAPPSTSTPKHAAPADGVAA